MLVPATRLGEVEDLAMQAVESIVVGDPRDARTTMGPVASRIQYERVRSYIVRGIEEGATLLCGGPGRPAGLTRGYFVRPTVFSRVNNAMTIAHEEIFGPVLAIIPYGSDQEAIDTANDTDYGLSSGVWSSDPARETRRSAHPGRNGLSQRCRGRSECAFWWVQEVGQGPGMGCLRTTGLAGDQGDHVLQCLTPRSRGCE
jgi:aldehyde dehydrogenase (NAD+)